MLLWRTVSCHVKFNLLWSQRKHHFYFHLFRSRWLDNRIYVLFWRLVFQWACSWHSRPLHQRTSLLRWHPQTPLWSHCYLGCSMPGHLNCSWCNHCTGTNKMSHWYQYCVLLLFILQLPYLYGHVMAEVVSCWKVTAEFWVQSSLVHTECMVDKITGLSRPSTLVCLCQYHSTSVPNSFLYHRHYTLLYSNYIIR